MISKQSKKKSNKLIFLFIVLACIIASVAIYNIFSKSNEKKFSSGVRYLYTYEDNNFVITVVDEDDNTIPVANAKFILEKVVITTNTEIDYIAPIDSEGNTLPKEHYTDGNGVISINLDNGIYRIYQEDSGNGYDIEEGLVFYFGINESDNVIHGLDIQAP